MAESNVDPTFPPDNQRVEKAKMRQQFATIKSETETQIKKTSVPWQIALSILSL